MGPQRSDLLPTLSGTLYLIGAGLTGVGLGIGVAAGIFHGRAPIEAAAPPAFVLAGVARDAGAVLPAPQIPPRATPPVAIAPSAPDPVQNDIEASAPPIEVARIGGADATASDLPQMLPSVTPPEAIAPVLDPVRDDAETPVSPVDVAGTESVGTAVSDPDEIPAPPAPVLVSLFRSAPVEEDLKPVVRVVEAPNECLVVDICVDDYLWSFYERTPKVDTNKVKARVKALVRKKGKTRTVMKTVTRYVVGDFTWKDPIAAQRAGISVKDYVIGGMDRGFKVKLYYALRTMEDAELMPGITSAFRDDYRQGIASGNKAASDSSYHGGSRRGGYGHGLAADLVSVKGETRLQRLASTVELWKWIDAREEELGIGRPYLDRDPPHVGPLDGKEYADKRRGAKAKLAGPAAKGRHPVASDHPGVTKPAANAGPVRVGSI